MARPVRRLFIAALCAVLFAVGVAYAETTRTDTPPVSVVMTPAPASSGRVDSYPVSVIMTPAPATSGRVDTPPVSVKVQQLKDVVPGLVAYWPMDGDWKDASGNENNGTPYGGATFSNISGVHGTNAGSFDGTNDYVLAKTSSLIANNSQNTISAWVYPTTFSIPAGYSHRMVYTENTTGGPVFYLGVKSTGTLEYGIWRTDISGNWTGAGTLTPLNLNSWNHLAATLDSSGMKIYINGVLLASAPNTKGSNATVAESDIGRDNFGGTRNHFAGNIDELALFDRALSAEEINSIYLNGITPPLHAPAVNPVVSPTADKNLTLSGTKDPLTSIWINGSEAVPLDASSTWQAAYTLTEGANIIKVSAHNASSEVSEEVRVDVMLDTEPPYAMDPSLVAYWPMDGDWDDHSGHGNSGASFGGATFEPNGRFGQAGSFDGVDDYVSVPDSPELRLGKNQSVEAWVKWSGAGANDWRRIVGKGDSVYRNYGLWLYPISGGSWLYQIYGAPSINAQAFMMPSTGWNHLVGTYDGNVTILYLNKVEIARQNYTGTPSTGDYPLTIGYANAGGPNGPFHSPFDGLIDEVAVYNRVLSIQEIAEHFNDGLKLTPMAQINGGNSVTASKDVSLQLTAMDSGTGVASMQFSNDGQAWSDWQAYAVSAGWTLDAADGEKTVYARFRDVAGNVSAIVSDTITLDTTAPEAPSITDYTTPVGGPSVTVLGSRDTEIVSVAVILNGQELTGASSSYPTETTWTAVVTGLADGENSIAVKGLDSAGNASDASADVTVVYDVNPPAWTRQPGVRFIEPGDGQAIVRWNGAEDAEGAGVSYNVYKSGTLPMDYSKADRVTVSAENGQTEYYQADEDFSDVQGYKNWYYYYWDGTTYREMTYDSNNNRWSGPYTYLLVWSNGGHPDGGKDAVRAWKAPANGSVKISGKAVDWDSRGGDGVNVYIKHKGSKVWEHNISNGDSTGVIYEIALTVAKGDFIYYHINQGGSNSYDSTAANPVIEFTRAGANLDGKGYDHQYTFSGLTNNKQYYFAVRALDGFGNEDGNAVTLKAVPQAVAGAVVHHLAEDWTGELDGVVVNADGELELAPGAGVGGYTSQTIDLGTGNSASAIAWDYASDETSGQTVTVELDSGDGWVSVTDGQQEGLPSGSNIRYRVTLTGDGITSPALKSVSLAYNDFLPPSAPVVNPYVSPTSQTVQLISGTKEPGSSIRVNGTERVAADESDSWSCAFTLVEGSNTLSITSMDAAGNESGPAAPGPVIVLDTTPPAFTVSYVSPSLTTTQTLTGTKEPGCVLKLDGTVIADAADLADKWSYEVALANGLLNKLVFTATDALGNTSTKTVNILCDTNPPSPLGPGVLEAYGEGDGTTVSLKWTAYNETLVPDLGYYKVYVSTLPITDVAGMTPVKTVNKGTKTTVVPGLVLGTTYYFAVVPVDQNGNFVTAVNDASAAPRDTKAPEEVTNVKAVPSFDPAAGSNIITLTWTASANSKGDLAAQKVYYDDGSGYDAGTDISASALTYTRPGVPDKTHVKFKITVLDESGNESAGRVAEATTRLDNPELTAMPGKNKVDLVWTKVVSPYLKNYRVYRLANQEQQADVSSMALVTATTGNTAAVSGLTNGETYQFAVTTVNTSDAENTDILSVSAAPRSDATGPSITVFEVKAGSTLIPAGGAVTKTATVSITASDTESAISKLELYIDGVLVKSQSGAAFTYTWDVVQTTDGNHQLMAAAYDEPGNKTELTKTYVVNLAPPSAPVIAGHTLVTGDLARVNGTAVAGTQVTLFLGGTSVAVVPAPNGTFQFEQVALSEGDNVLAAKASHRGGESPLSAVYKIVIDTGAPEPPVSLGVKALDAGKAKFTWLAGAGELPASYNLYRSASQFASPSEAGVSKANSSQIKYQIYEYKPPDDNLWYHAVTSVDASGNESGISNVVSVATDRVAPHIAGTPLYTCIRPDGSQTTPASVAGPGRVEVSFAVSEPLAEPPFFSLTPATGSPIVVALSKLDDTHYKGSFAVTSFTTHGQTQYSFTGKDAAGNRGESQGTGITIDVKGPVASVTEPLSLLKLSAEPVAVIVVFDEHPVGLPSIELVDYAGTPAQVTGLADTGDGRHYTGMVDVSGMADGEAEFRLLSAMDGFGNGGDTIASGGRILLYTDMPPAPPAPEGLTATSGKAGKITLAWKPAGGALAYKLYRRATGDGEPVFIQSGLTGTSTVDTPEFDGAYLYSVSAVGQMSSEGERSAEAPAVSDRTPPDAPTGLALTFGASGVTASWSAPTGEVPATYRLYRSSSAITSGNIGSLTSVKTGIKALSASDASPVNSIRYYAVTALDALGNEGPPSESADITFPVAPVRNLILIRLDGGAPVLTWEKPQPEVVGYNIYRNGARLTPSPVNYTAYTDSYFGSGTVSYGISAVDGYGNESPVKEVTYSGFDAGLAPGVTLNRGYLQKVPVLLVNPGEAPVTVDSIDLKVGSGAQSTMTGPFAVGAGSTVQVEKIGSTALDAPSTVAVSVLAEWSPSPGVTVMVSTTREAPVIGAGATIEIFSEPLVRGADARVRLKLYNQGDANMEFVTSENGGPTSKAMVYLKDQDGNVLAQAKLNQRADFAGKIINGASYAVARLAPGESFVTDEMTFPVPLMAPYAVNLVAAVSNTYYNYGKPDQVTAPGVSQTMPTNINEAAYRAVAAVEQTFYSGPQPVVITGQAISNATDGPMPLVPVVIGVSVRGFDRYYTVNTDSEGKFSYTFRPGSNEAGIYSVWANHPDVKNRTVQATFTIAGLQMSPSTAKVSVLRGGYYDIPLTLKNPGDTPLTGITYAISAGDGVGGSVVGGPARIDPGKTVYAKFRVSASLAAPDVSYVKLDAATAEGPAGKLDATVIMVSAIPVITVTPRSYIDTGVVRGDQRLETLTLKNTGAAALLDARIEGPSAGWMSLATDRAIGEVPPGGTVQIAVIFRPDASIAPKVCSDSMVITSANHIPYRINLQCTVVTDAVGSARFDVLNSLNEKVAGASVRIQNAALSELVYTKTTDSLGGASFTDIPAGSYVYSVSASGCKPYSASFEVLPGVVRFVPVGLEVTLVEVEFTVTPVVIEDRYEIKITQTFRTDVPVPVLVVDPPVATLPRMAVGQVYNGEFTVTNYGLISATSAKLSFPASYNGYTIEILDSIPDTIGAKQTITVPYRVIRNQ